MPSVRSRSVRDSFTWNLLINSDGNVLEDLRHLDADTISFLKQHFTEKKAGAKQQVEKKKDENEDGSIQNRFDLALNLS
mgnify:CR=1 FL=1